MQGCSARDPQCFVPVLARVASEEKRKIVRKLDGWLRERFVEDGDKLLTPHDLLASCGSSPIPFISLYLNRATSLNSAKFDQ